MKPMFGDVECPKCFEHVEVNTNCFPRPTGFISSETDETDMECTECGKYFKVTRTVTVDFKSKKG